MYRQAESRNFLFRLLIGSIIIAIGFLFLSFLLLSSNSSDVSAQETNLFHSDNSIGNINSSNVVTASFANIAKETRLTTLQIKDGAVKSTRGARIAVIAGSRKTANGIILGSKITISVIGNGIDILASSIGKSALLIAKMPSNIINSLGQSAIIKNIIRPSDYEKVAIIDPNSPELLAALVALPPTLTNAQSIQSNPATGPIWPINGRVTTNFGVPHRPYQSVHTGMDISDGKHSGVTPIKPFRAGKVIETIKSKSGYGNHVIIDHGNGVTSIYAHLYSIKVNIGQEVDTNSIIGFEGSTGMSTGTHLHFEVRVNGKAANPRKFIDGQP